MVDPEPRISNENAKPGSTALIPFGVGVWRDRWNFYFVRFGLSGIPRPLIGGLWPRPAHKGGLLAGALSTLIYARCEYTYVHGRIYVTGADFARTYMCTRAGVHRRRKPCVHRVGLSQDWEAADGEHSIRHGRSNQS